MREEHDLIDRAIDDTAQAMTAAPPPNLRARVAEGMASRRPAWPLAWPAVAAAAAIVLAMLLWPESRLKPAPTTEEQIVSRQPAPAESFESFEPFEPSEPVERPRATTAPATRVAAPLIVLPLALETIAVEDLEIPALAEIPTLVVETIDLAPLEMQ